MLRIFNIYIQISSSCQDPMLISVRVKLFSLEKHMKPPLNTSSYLVVSKVNYLLLENSNSNYCLVETCCVAFREIINHLREKLLYVRGSFVLTNSLLSNMVLYRSPLSKSQNRPSKGQIIFYPHSFGKVIEKYKMQAH